MIWKILDFEDFTQLGGNIKDGLLGSDSALVNLYLLQKKYDIHTSIKNNFLFRYYTGSKNRTGYGFPMELKLKNPEEASEDLLEHFYWAFEEILADSKEYGRSFQFCLLTECQLHVVQKWLAEKHPDFTIESDTNRDDCDYIYERKKLAELSGKIYHKKKNHVSKFLRTYEGRWEFRLTSLCNIDDDLIKVSEEWLGQRFGKDVPADERKILEMELESIRFAVKNKKLFALEGGVLYVDSKPVAMTLASKISENVYDIHYEKCLEAEAAFGAYAAINWCFANACVSVEYFNREEDMGIEGLRKAKLSYHPDLLLNKYYCEIK